MTDTPTSQVTEVAHNLRIAVNRTTRQLRAAGARKITLTQMSAMATIKEAGQLTLGELATRERVQPPSMTRVIATLTDNGLVERISDPADGRQVLVSLTPEGREVLAEEGRTREAWLSQALADLPPAELKVLAEASDIMMRLVGE